MELRPVLRSVFALAAVAVLWFIWWAFGRSPEAQIRAAQAAFLAAVEDRDWEDVADYLAPDYTDAYGHTRDSAVADAKKYLGMFFALSIKADQATVQAAADQGMLKEIIRMEGRGAGYSQAVVDHVNRITTPWAFHWSKAGAWPWTWQVTMILNDDAQ